MSRTLSLSASVTAVMNLPRVLVHRTLQQRRFTVAAPWSPASVVTSNHARGTSFEHYAINVLRSLSSASLTLALTHHGGARDQGVDFLGTLSLPLSLSPLTFPLIGQCKYEAKPMGPIHLRSLEGSMVHYRHRHSHNDSQSLIGVLVSAGRYTSQAEAQWKRSTLPIILVTVDPTSNIHTRTDSSNDTDNDIDWAPVARVALKRFSLNPVAQRLLPTVRIDRYHDANGLLRLALNQR